MAQIQPDVKKFMHDYSVREDEIWLVAGGKSYAIKHSALERIAAEQTIKFGPPHIIEANGADGIATIVVTATRGDVAEWSFGEASPKNNKNAYPFAMAEKRAKDRCTLKLLKAHGAIYSEDEADDFKIRADQPLQRREAVDEVSAYIAKSKTAIQNEDNLKALGDWWRAESDARQTLRIVKGTPDYEALYTALMNKSASLKPKLQEAAE